MLRSHAMTIGQLSRRSGVPIKILRTYEDLGFLYTRGRSESNYRLFGEETLWCVQVVQGLRSLGLTLKEIRALLTPLVSTQARRSASCWKHPWRRLSPVSKRDSRPSRRCVNASWSSRPPRLPHQPSPLSLHWCSCWRQIHAVALCFLPLDSPTGGRLYTLCVAMHDSLACWWWARRLVFQAGMAEPPALA